MIKGCRPCGLSRGRSGLARSCGQYAWGWSSECDDSPVGEVAHSSAALSWRWAGRVRAFPLVVSVGIRSFFANRASPVPSAVPRRTRRDSTRDGKPSFPRMRLRIESPLNIRTGSSRARGGTRLNGRFRETIHHEGGLAELAVTQLASPRGGNTMLPPGPKAPALVKSCERYRSNHLGSITPNAKIETSNPGGQTPVRGLERGKAHQG